ncbi:sulfocyanin-like copper-binding protein [Amycolatopsis rhizosphaerae]|nr:sulfocyanin-like copper-binding protein [Amycolatopsis rhizosphaerae]
MKTQRLHGGRLVVLVIAAALVLGVATTAVLAATGVFRPTPSATRCGAPVLPGQVVDVTASDMGRGMMGGPGMMRLWPRPATVRPGQVSLRVFNAGSQAHEVLVLPLAAGQTAGNLPVGSDGKVDETGSLGEASNNCGAGEGDGIEPGAVGWTTVTLQPGRYELLCNMPGHYAAGMYTELDVTGA